MLRYRETGPVHPDFHRTLNGTIAYLHRQLFSSGFHGDQTQVREIWRTLYEFGVDVVIAGHEHSHGMVSQRCSPIKAPRASAV